MSEIKTLIFSAIRYSLPLFKEFSTANKFDQPKVTLASCLGIHSYT